MKIINRKIYIANDGYEFSDKKKCLKWETRKFHKNLINLTNEEIIGLLKTFYCLLDGEDVPTNIRVELKAENNSGTGFLYKITINSSNDSYDNRIIIGLVDGYNDCHWNPIDEIKENDISFPWVGVKDIYEYLDSIGFWKGYKFEPVKNADIIFEWKIIWEVSLPGNK